MEPLEAGRRLLLVHAHPDDESIGCGATMAHYAAQGAGVTLVTCTRGELGEVIPPDLAHLAADADDELGPYRVGELANAMRALGVTDHRFLDGGPPVVYRDSGMAYDEDGRVIPLPDPRPGAFALAEVDDAAQRLVQVIREVRPQVLVTYEPGGGYGHPDHVQAHRVAMRAVELAADPGQGEAEAWQVAKVYWSVVPEGVVRAGLAALAEQAARGPLPFETFLTRDRLPSMVVPDGRVTTIIDGTAFLPAKLAALRAHATQVQVRDGWMALSNGLGQPVVAQEWFEAVRGTPVPDPTRADGLESDLFAGL